MILIDTSVWVDHFRKPVALLVELMRQRKVLMHPFVLGELAAGNFRNWDVSVAELQAFPQVFPVDQHRYLETVRNHGLMGTGLSFVDIHLLATALEDRRIGLLTHDRKLGSQSERLGLVHGTS